MIEVTQEEYNAMSTVDKVRYMESKSAEAAKLGTYASRCVNGEPVFFVEADKAYRPGHIYSQAGVDEYGISKACEYHFDNWFAEDE